MCLLKHTDFSSLRVLQFVMCRLPYPDSLLFSYFNSDEFTNTKFWVFGSSYPWLLYLIWSGVGVLPCIQYEAPFFKLSKKADIKGIYVNRVSTDQVRPGDGTIAQRDTFRCILRPPSDASSGASDVVPAFSCCAPLDDIPERAREGTRPKLGARPT